MEAVPVPVGVLECVTAAVGVPLGAPPLGELDAATGELDAPPLGELDAATGDALAPPFGELDAATGDALAPLGELEAATGELDAAAGDAMAWKAPGISRPRPTPASMPRPTQTVR